jgi:hypothetical protein
MKLSSALFQSSVWLEAIYPEGTVERQIADICWQAFKALEPIGPSPTCSAHRDAVESLDRGLKSR